MFVNKMIKKIWQRIFKATVHVLEESEIDVLKNDKDPPTIYAFCKSE